jgi:hypothetical protein
MKMSRRTSTPAYEINDLVQHSYVKGAIGMVIATSDTDETGEPRLDSRERFSYQVYWSTPYTVGRFENPYWHFGYELLPVVETCEVRVLDSKNDRSPG